MMRYVNRRRLLIVVLLAAMFGAVLPWIELFLPPGEFHTGRWVSNGRFTLRHDSTWNSQFTSVLTISAASPEDLIAIKRECHGLFPQITELPASSTINCRRAGWPLRALYEGELITTDQHTQLAPASIETPDLGWLTRYAPYEIPIGILWGGMVGNIAVVVLTLGGGYVSLAYGRARWRIKRGRCVACGYLSQGAAVCPECGSSS